MFQPFVHLLSTLNVSAQQGIHRVNVHRHRDMFSINGCQDLVLVGGPLRKGLNIFPDSSVVCMEEMRPVQVDTEAGFVVNVVIAIATNVIPLF
jgi:hypothetical protein